jgi:hypothetical protein
MLKLRTVKLEVLSLKPLPGTQSWTCNGHAAVKAINYAGNARIDVDRRPTHELTMVPICLELTEKKRNERPGKKHRD